MMLRAATRPRSFAPLFCFLKSIDQNPTTRQVRQPAEHGEQAPTESAAIFYRVRVRVSRLDGQPIKRNQNDAGGVSMSEAASANTSGRCMGQASAMRWRGNRSSMAYTTNKKQKQQQQRGLSKEQNNPRREQKDRRKRTCRFLTARLRRAKTKPVRAPASIRLLQRQSRMNSPNRERRRRRRRRPF